MARGIKRGIFGRIFGRNAFARYYRNQKSDGKQGILRIFDQFSNLSPETKRTIFSIISFSLGILLLLSLLDKAGIAGIKINYYASLALGFSRWYFPFILFYLGYLFLRSSERAIHGLMVFGAFLFFIALNNFIHLVWYSDNLVSAASKSLGGGYVGLAFSYLLYRYMGFWAGLIILFSLTIIGLVIFLNISFQNAANVLKKIKSFLFTISPKQKEREEEAEEAIEEEVKEFGKKKLPLDYEIEEGAEDNASLDQVIEPPPLEKRRRVKIDLPIDLLSAQAMRPMSGDIEANQEIIRKTLANFNISVEMGEVSVGPTVTQYTLKPFEGIKLSKIVGLSDNLALALAAHPIRIEAPIPGKSLVGIEVPNKSAAIVSLRSIIESKEFAKRKSNLMIALGKDVKGTPWLADIERMPHLLIAGATGSGKSVCINSIVVSLLYQNGPDDLKFILVDPKRVELPMYNGIPHLIAPVITDVKKTVHALRWAIKEMEDRFDKLSEFHKRDILSYNRDVEEKMPYIIIIIDELADMMVAAGAEIEGLIVRLAQMSRAVGIHLILATQRPSVDIITGLIKANITSRIAFSVASLIDSRTILDMSGAEKLLGKGDMLYISSDLSKPRRLQGAYSLDDDIKKVIEYLKSRGEPEYLDEVVERASEYQEGIFQGSGVLDNDDNGLIQDAKKVIFEAGKASASLLQRRLKIGYSRAARILDVLEEKGIIGPADGAKPREILSRNEKNNEIDIENEGVEEERE